MYASTGWQRFNPHTPEQEKNLRIFTFVSQKDKNGSLYVLDLHVCLRAGIYVMRVLPLAAIT